MFESDYRVLWIILHCSIAKKESPLTGISLVKAYIPLM